LKSKTNQAALGLRVKSGWTAAILLADPARAMARRAETRDYRRLVRPGYVMSIFAR